MIEDTRQARFDESAGLRSPVASTFDAEEGALAQPAISRRMLRMARESHHVGAKVLVASDLSPPADEAIRQADEWATRLGTELVVCHVMHALQRANPLFPKRNEADAVSALDLERHVAELVTARVSELTGRSPDSFRLVIDVGRPEAGILRAATTMNVDLIVMGSRGDTGPDRILLGGVSERVVRHAHCSVLVARPTAARGRVLAATDLSDPSFPAISVGALEARRRGANLVVMHNLDVWPPPAGPALGSSAWSEDPNLVQEQRERAAQQLKEIVGRLDVEAECRVTHGAPDAAIVQLADEVNPELLVIGTHGRTGLARLALGSVAERVVETATWSVLVVRVES